MSTVAVILAARTPWKLVKPPISLIYKHMKSHITFNVNSANALLNVSYICSYIRKTKLSPIKMLNKRGKIEKKNEELSHS